MTEFIFLKGDAFSMEYTYTQDFIAMDETTTRIHLNPKEALGSLEHVRSKEFRNRESHVDADGGHFEVWLDKPVYDVYDELFGEHIRTYNENQKTKCRRILDANGDEVGGYIEKIQTGRRGKRERAVYKKMPDGTKEAVGKKEESQGQRILYEMVVSSGNCEKKRDERGRILYTDDGHEIHPMRVPYEVNKAAVKKFYEQFETFYPHLKLTTAAFHSDEFYWNAKGVKEYGVEHAHLCFVPWADGYQRGLPVQASISKALEQMGFKNGRDDDGVWHNAYWYFTADAQERFEEILQHEYVSYQKQRGAKIEGSGLFAAMGCVPGLFFVHPAKGKNLPNLDPAEYRGLKDAERQVNMAKEELDSVLEKIDAKNRDLEHAKQVIAKAEEKEKNIDDCIASKLEDAEQYCQSRKEEADALIREAEEKHRERLQEAELRFGHIESVCKKILEDLEFYRKRCTEVLKGHVSLDIPIPALERWMKKRKLEKNGMRVSVYDACMEELSPVLERRAKKQQEAAGTLSNEVRKQMELAEESLKDGKDNEDDTGYGYAV